MIGSRNLLAVSVGPVQDFIAAARRTRDLWYGSHILSEISKSVALALYPYSELIFPAPLDPDHDLLEGSSLNVANIILCLTKNEQNPRRLSELAVSSAKNRWRREADKALGRASAAAHALHLNEKRWAEQVDDVVEIYTAWVPFDASVEDYRKKRGQLMRLLAGRKACREFVQAPPMHHRVPKSSLDGRRESVFDGKIDVALIPLSLRNQLRLTDGEQLDAVGLTKRLGGDRHGCPSVSTVAASPWSRGAELKCPDQLATLRSLCDPLVARGLARANWTQFHAFPYEGAIAFKSRLSQLKKEFRGITELKDDHWDEVKYIKLALDDIYETCGEPAPYYVILAADGDRMGSIISSLTNLVGHRAFSGALSRFAANARQIIEEHFGWPVYVGGDDILAFLPLDTAVPCGKALYEQFVDRFLSSGIETTPTAPTLSIGLAIVHYLEPLEVSLEHARSAEKAAKGTNRNGLAIHYHPGSGSPVLARGRWDEGFSDWIESLTLLHFESRISDKAGYDLRELSVLYDNWPHRSETSEIMRADIIRLLCRKPAKFTSITDQNFALRSDGLNSAEDVRKLANEMIIARLFGRSRFLSGWRPAVSKSGGTE